MFLCGSSLKYPKQHLAQTFKTHFVFRGHVFTLLFALTLFIKLKLIESDGKKGKPLFDSRIPGCVTQRTIEFRSGTALRVSQSYSGGKHCAISMKLSQSRSCRLIPGNGWRSFR